MNAIELGRLLNVDSNTVRRWIKMKWLKASGRGRRLMVSRIQLIDFADKFPHYFIDLDNQKLDDLFWEDTAILNKIIKEKSKPRKKKGVSRRVIHLPTGKVAPSVRAMSRQLYYSKPVIYKMIQKGEVVYG